MARLNSWIIILLADFALGAVLLYIPGVWSYEIIIMYILCGRAVLVRSGSPVSDLLWLIIVWALDSTMVLLHSTENNTALQL